jgi:hypothetical protein
MELELVASGDVTEKARDIYSRMTKGPEKLENKVLNGLRDAMRADLGESV